MPGRTMESQGQEAARPVKRPAYNEPPPPGKITGAEQAKDNKHLQLCPENMKLAARSGTNG